MPHNIAIIGAGPAGLFAAEILSAAGHNVTVYDRKLSAARKFLMAGRGGLNLTHSEPLENFVTRYGATQPFMEPLIRAFAPDNLRAWCEGLGQETFVGTSGRVFPKSMKASPLLRAWLSRLAAQGVTFHLNMTWTGWNDDGALSFADGETIRADAVLLTLGGASWPGLGSDGTWAAILQKKKIPLAPFAPSNCGFAVPWSDYIKTRFAGQPLKNVRLTHGNHSVIGEMVVSENGIEGGAVYALSSSLRDAIARDGKTTLTLDFHPHQEGATLTEHLSGPRGRQSFPSFMRRALNLGPLPVALLYEADQHIGTQMPGPIAALVKSCPIILTAPFAIDRAISSAGGIALDALDGNLMLKNLPGVFSAGEMLDWEAPTGGYLLQGCFATAMAAAEGIKRFLAAR